MIEPMLQSAANLTLLAQRSAWQGLGTRFSGDHLRWQIEDLVGLIAIVLMIAGGFWLLSRLSTWQQGAATRPSPKQLFKELCDAHGLSHSERRVCREVAAQSGATDAAEVFVRPETRALLAGQNPDLAERLYGPADAPA